MTEVDDTHLPTEPIVIRASIVNRPARDSRSHGRAHDIAAMILAFAKDVAWPLLVAILFLIFQQEIRRTIALIPDKLEKADKANIGTLAWEFQRRAKEQGGSDLALRVGTLSPSAIEVLIRTPRAGISTSFLTSYWSFPDNVGGYILPETARLNSYRELLRAELIKSAEPFEAWIAYVNSLPMQVQRTGRGPQTEVEIVITPLTEDQKNRIRAQHYELTPKGEQAVQAIVEVIGDHLR